MPVRTSIRSDYIAFHRSLAAEIKSTKNQVRNLIGGKHWLTDGEFKEVILRKVLRNRLPDNFRVGRGFICSEERISTQIDVLITHANKPVIFREGDLSFVTPDSVAAIVEVKTKLTTRQEFFTVLNKLAEELAFVRQATCNPESIDPHPCWGGLFTFDEPVEQREDITEELLRAKCEALLSALAQASAGSDHRAVNCVSLGQDVFSRYWRTGTASFDGMLRGPGWHSYLFTGKHKNLSPAYFVGNLVMDLAYDLDSRSSFAWFPIREGGGKEQYRTHSVGLSERQPHRFQL